MKDHGPRNRTAPCRRLRWLGAAILLAAATVPLSAAQAQDAEDPKSLALAAQLVEIAGTKRVMNQMLDQMGPMLTHLIERANPGKEAQVDEVMERFVLPKIADSMSDLMHESALLYAKHFTTEELGQLVGFYQSPVGQKLTQELPGMMQEMSGFAKMEGQKVALDALKAYADEFRKRGLQTPI